MLNLFPWKKKEPDFFTPEEKEAIVKAIQEAEQRTSGEIRIYVESRCSYMDALDRARELFFQLGMDKTKDRNGTLIYLAVKDHQFAVFGDEGIHQKLGTKYWQDEVSKMVLLFKKHNLVDGICQGIKDIGEALVYYFPYDRETDKNELPDEIVFGK